MNLLDSLNRPLHSLRVSVTDRCNLRCAYCMPEEEYAWLKSPSILSFEEISTLVDVFVGLGVRKVRLTGGEPLVRRDLPTLVKLLAAKNLDDLALTTNGVLLAEHAQALRDAGLHRITVSLDTLQPQVFAKLTRRDQHAGVLAGIEAARSVGFALKLDAVVLRGVNDSELVELLDYARSIDAELRFIEYMDVGGATHWSPRDLVSRAEILKKINAERGEPVPFPTRGSAPAEQFRLPSGQVFGVIGSTTAPFCRSCDRSRLTADGTWYTCLYNTNGVDLRTQLREGDIAAVTARVRARWLIRRDAGAEQRLGLFERGPLLTADELRTDPRLEMHTRGG